MVIEQAQENQSVLLESGKKKRGLLCLALLAVLILNGCIFKREPYPKTTCNVYSVEGMTGSHNLMCQNSSDIYLYSNGGIYRYKDGGMELLTEVEIEVDYMACNSQVLYYESANSLYRVYLKDGRKECVAKAVGIMGMASHGEDIFMMLNMERCVDYMTKGMYLYCYHGAEEGIILDGLLQEEVKQPGLYTTVSYGSYIIGGYKTEAYKSDQGDEVEGDIRTLLVKAEDGWSFSIDCDGKVYYDIEGEVLWSEHGKYNYKGKQHEMESVLAVENYGERTTASHSAIVGEEIYMLYQYGDKYQGYGENPAARFKKRDAFFVLNPEKQACKLIYAPKKRSTQIAGFSVEKQILYLLEDDGIYRCDFDGKNKKKLLDNHYEELSFEYCDGKLFVFFSSDNGEAEFLAAVE